MADYDELHDGMIMAAITPRKYRKWDAFAVAIQTVGLMVGAVSDAFTDTASMLLRHSEYVQMREEFHEEAAVELETLIADVEGTE